MSFTHRFVPFDFDAANNAIFCCNYWVGYSSYITSALISFFIQVSITGAAKSLILCASNPKRLGFLVSSCSCLCLIHGSQVLSRAWRYSWGNADGRCSNYILVTNNGFMIVPWSIWSNLLDQIFQITSWVLIHILKSNGFKKFWLIETEWHINSLRPCDTYMRL